MVSPSNHDIKKRPRVSEAFSVSRFLKTSLRRIAEVRITATSAAIATSAGHETVLAENRAAAFLYGAGLERNLARCAALGTDCVMQFTRSTIGLAGVAAVLAALWSAQVLAGVKLLLTVGEREYGAAIAAG